MWATRRSSPPKTGEDTSAGTLCVTGLAVGRTWRLGGPHYIVVWEIESAARIDEWMDQRRSDPEAARLIDEWFGVVDCNAGVYEHIGPEQS